MSSTCLCELTSKCYRRVSEMDWKHLHACRCQCVCLCLLCDVCVTCLAHFPAFHPLYTGIDPASLQPWKNTLHLFLCSIFRCFLTFLLFSGGGWNYLLAKISAFHSLHLLSHLLDSFNATYSACLYCAQTDPGLKTDVYVLFATSKLGNDTK